MSDASPDLQPEPVDTAEGGEPDRLETATRNMRRPGLNVAPDRLFEVLGWVLVPLGVLVAAIFIAVSYYSVRTTGSPVRTPYLENVFQYNPVPYFAWQSMKPTPPLMDSRM